MSIRDLLVAGFVIFSLAARYLPLFTHDKHPLPAPHSFDEELRMVSMHQDNLSEIRA